MKNKKIILVFILIIMCLFMTISRVKATNPLDVKDITGNQEQTGGNTQTPDTNTQPTPVPSPTPSPSPTAPTSNGNTNGNSAQTNSLPDTGVAEDTALFVFITICVASSIYAFVKIRNYKNI